MTDATIFSPAEVGAGAGSGLDPDALRALLRRVTRSVDGGHLEALRERVELLRYGAGRVVYQHAEDRPVVRIRLVRGGREGWSIVESADSNVIAAAADRIAVELDSLPTGEPAPMPGVWPFQAAPGAAAGSTVGAAASERAAALRRLSAAIGDPEIAIGGSIATRVVDAVVVNTRGLCVVERRTRAAIQLVASGPGRSSSVRRIDPDWAAIDPEELAQAAMATLPGTTRGDLPAGPVRALLGPQAVAAFAAVLAHIGLGAVPPGGAPGPLDPGDEGSPILAAEVSFVDDATDPAGLPASFDPAGWPKRRVTLIEDGRVVGRVHDVVTAAIAGVEPTGHTAPPGWRFGRGPAPMHVLVGPGSAGPTDLEAAVGDGIAIQRVDYVRVVQPRQGLVTGTTRDATVRIRSGRRAEALPQFRFTLRLADLFAAVEAVGRDRERGEAPFIDSITAPAMVVSAFPIDSEARR